MIEDFKECLGFKFMASFVVGTCSVFPLKYLNIVQLTPEGFL